MHNVLLHVWEFRFNSLGWKNPPSKNLLKYKPNPYSAQSLTFFYNKKLPKCQKEKKYSGNTSSESKSLLGRIWHIIFSKSMNRHT